MKVINITPVYNNKVIGRYNPNMHMLLAHLALSDTAYVQWARRLKKSYKIMDNSLIELGGSMGMREVVEAALRTESQEIILEDVFQDGPATVAAVERSLDYLGDIGLLKQFKLQAVCQGKTLEEFKETFKILNSMPEIDVIGIPKVTAKLTPQGRPFLESLWTTPDFKKEIHLLGLWYSWYELLEYEFPEAIRSVDTCLAAFQAKYDRPVNSTRPDGHSISLTDVNISSTIIAEKIREARKELKRCGLKI